MPTNTKGLSSSEAKSLLQKFGPNSLPETPPPSNLSLLLAQVKNPLVYILLAASAITALLGHFSDTLIIVFAVGINTSLGFFQERRANRALVALKNLIHPQAKIVRDGTTKTIDVESIVPGDISVLTQGSKIPADGVVLESNRFFVSEAILTGESASVTKTKGDQVFMGTIVVSGNAKMLVKLTGAGTEIGKIATNIQSTDEDTPLRSQLKRFSKHLTILVLALTTFVFLIGFLAGDSFEDIFTASVALAVSSIPEGVLVALTVILAIGMQRILKRKGLVRHLMSAETLGSVTTICVDKTGTLTEGNMQVVDCFGDEKALATQAILANDLDDPITIAAWEWATKKKGNHQSLLKRHKRLDSLPFSSKSRFYASLNKESKSHNYLYINGAPEYLLKLSRLGKTERTRVTNHIDLLTSQGRRVMGMARIKVPAKKSSLTPNDIKKAKLEWVGLLSFSDPVREGVRDAIAKVKNAGIKIIVITGDYPKTAISVMEELGLDVDQAKVMTGAKLSMTSEKVLTQRLQSNSIKLFARTTPDQKLKIVEALKDNGEIVAMMGDGVNDAPALKKADIGVVVGDATDVAKETADLILLDNNFATIVAAIEEGRGIFDNIRKVLLYLMSDSFEEIVCVVGTIILGLPLPVTAAQILWINLVSDGFPDIALTVDPKDPSLMHQPPRSTKENIVNAWMREIIFIVSLFGGLIALVLFVFFYSRTQDVILARSIAFATLGVNSLVYVFSIKTLTEPFWHQNPLNNPWLNVAVFAGLILQFLPFSTPGTRAFFGLSTLNEFHLLAVFTASFIMFIMIEATKGFRKSIRPQQ